MTNSNASNGSFEKLISSSLMVLLFGESILVELSGLEYLLKTLFYLFFCVTTAYTTTSSTIVPLLLFVMVLPYVMDNPLFISPDTLKAVLCFSMVLDEFNNALFVGLYKFVDEVELINFEYDLFAYCKERISFKEFCCLYKVDVNCLLRYVVLVSNAATCSLNIISSFNNL